MFLLKLYDRKGKELNEGDIVAVSDGKRFTFYCEVKYLAKEKVIAPFHTFSFHSFEKVDKVPANAVESTEERYKIWYIYNEEATADEAADKAKNYLMDWRECEHLLSEKCFQIQLNKT
jgi:intein/homing endonuclease